MNFCDAGWLLLLELAKILTGSNSSCNCEHNIEVLYFHNTSKKLSYRRETARQLRMSI